MEEVVKFKKPLLRKSVIPTRKDIVSAFAVKLGFSPQPIIYDSILNPLAEATERMLFDLAEHQTLVVEMVSGRSGYRCRVCSGQFTTDSYRYCPHCGTRIKWIQRNKY